MFRKMTIVAACVALFAVGCGGGSEEPEAEAAPEPIDAGSAVSEAVAAMGMENLDSITYSGTGFQIRNSFLQTANASPPWSGDDITNYVRTIDLTQPASRATGDTFREPLFLGGPVAGTYTQNVPANQTNWAQQMEIWLTPWGFLRGAEANGAEATSQMIDGADYSVVTWMSPATQTSPSGMRYTVTGYLNDQNLVERVETWAEHPMLGDMHVQYRYSDYADHGGVMVPNTVVQEEGGGTVFSLAVDEATPNPENLAELMTPPEGGGGRGGRGGGRGGRGGAGDAPVDLIEEVADGVYLVTGGYVALVVEFADHLAVFEGPQSEARGQQILDQIAREIPDKPIRYIINSHPHSDHSSGLAPFLRAGATLVTHSNNVAFLDMAFSTPRTLLGEPTMDPEIIGVDDMMVLEDDTNRLELYSVPNLHTDGMLVAFVPAARILFQADFTLPQGGAEPNPFVVTLAERVDELGLDFDRYLAVHAAAEPQTKAQLMAAIGQ